MTGRSARGRVNPAQIEGWLVEPAGFRPSLGDIAGRESTGCNRPCTYWVGPECRSAPGGQYVYMRINQHGAYCTTEGFIGEDIRYSS